MWARLYGAAHRHFPVRRFGDFVAFRFGAGPQREPDDRFVLYDEDCRPAPSHSEAFPAFITYSDLPSTAPAPPPSRPRRSSRRIYPLSWTKSAGGLALTAPAPDKSACGASSPTPAGLLTRVIILDTFGGGFKHAEALRSAVRTALARAREVSDESPYALKYMRKEAGPPRASFAEEVLPLCRPVRVRDQGNPARGSVAARPASAPRDPRDADQAGAEQEHRHRLRHRVRLRHGALVVRPDALEPQRERLGDLLGVHVRKVPGDREGHALAGGDAAVAGAVAEVAARQQRHVEHTLVDAG